MNLFENFRITAHCTNEEQDHNQLRISFKLQVIDLTVNHDFRVNNSIPIAMEHVRKGKQRNETIAQKIFNIGM